MRKGTDRIESSNVDLGHTTRSGVGKEEDRVVGLTEMRKTECTRWGIIC